MYIIQSVSSRRSLSPVVAMVTLIALAVPMHVNANAAGLTGYASSVLTNQSYSAPGRTVDVRALARVSASAVRAAPIKRPRYSSGFSHANVAARPGTAISDGRSRVASPTVVGAAPTLNSSFGGLAVLDNTVGIEPPDTQVAAGPTALLEMVNSVGRVYDKSGIPMGATFSLQAFFGIVPPLIQSDARVLFDRGTNRWYASSLGFDTSPVAGGSAVYLAISITSDPTGLWIVYTLLPQSGLICDQPKLGYSRDKLVIGCSNFDPSPQFAGAILIAINKSDALSGGLLRYAATAPDTHKFGFVPAQDMQSSSPAYGAFTLPPSFGGFGVFRILGTPGVSTVSIGFALVSRPSPALQPAGAPQSGSSALIDNGDERFMSAVLNNGILSTSMTVGCNPTGDPMLRSCLDLVQVDVATPSIVQDEVAGIAGKDIYYPTVALDASDNVVIGYSFSSSTEYPGFAAVIELAGTRLFVQVAVTAGTGPYFSGGTLPQRWGDYGGGSIDPAQPTRVWIAGEFSNAPGTAALAWGTSLASIEPVQAVAGRYTALTPARILDTRIGLGVAAAGPVPVASTVVLDVHGNGGVPLTGAAAVVLNLTVTAPAGVGFLTVWPHGEPKPLASSLNFAGGQTVAGLVQVRLGTDGKVSIYVANTLQLIGDVEGWVNAVPAGPDGRFNPMVPTRLLDTRTPGGGGMKIAPAGGTSVVVTGGQVPSSATAVVLNLTVTNPAAGGFITAWSHDVSRPTASNLNFSGGQTIANRAIVGIGPGGRVDFYNGGGAVDLIVDVAGWFTGNSGTTGGAYFPLSPSRFLDTRTIASPIPPGGGRTLQISGVNGVPMMGAGAPSAVVITITVTNGAAGGFVTVWPDGHARPLASDLNWSTGSTLANLVLVGLGSDGYIDLYNGGGTADFIVDVVGYYDGPPLP